MTVFKYQDTDTINYSILERPFDCTVIRKVFATVAGKGIGLILGPNRDINSISDTLY